MIDEIDENKNISTPSTPSTPSTSYTFSFILDHPGGGSSHGWHTFMAESTFQAYEKLQEFLALEVAKYDVGRVIFPSEAWLVCPHCTGNGTFLKCKSPRRHAGVMGRGDFHLASCYKSCKKCNGTGVFLNYG